MSGLVEGCWVSVSGFPVDLSVAGERSIKEGKGLGVQIWESPKIGGTLFWGPYKKGPTT